MHIINRLIVLNLDCYHHRRLLLPLLLLPPPDSYCPVGRFVLWPPALLGNRSVRSWAMRCTSMMQPVVWLRASFGREMRRERHWPPCG